jgi:hypothetical protein
MCRVGNTPTYKVVLSYLDRRYGTKAYAILTHHLGFLIKLGHTQIGLIPTILAHSIQQENKEAHKLTPLRPTIAVLAPNLYPTEW